MCTDKGIFLKNLLINSELKVNDDGSDDVGNYVGANDDASDNTSNYFGASDDAGNYVGANDG